MVYIWLLILAGVIIVPIISGAARNLESRLKRTEGEATKESRKKQEQKKEDMKFAIKLLTYTVIVIFIAIVIIMAKFTGQIIYSD